MAHKKKNHVTMKAPSQCVMLGSVTVPVWGDLPEYLDRLVAKGYAEDRAEAFYELAITELRSMVDGRNLFWNLKPITYHERQLLSRKAS